MQHLFGNKKFYLFILFAALALFLFLYIATSDGGRDYQAYLIHWQRIFDGVSPWKFNLEFGDLSSAIKKLSQGQRPWQRIFDANTYGPANVLLSFPYYIHPQFNRYIFGLLFYLTSVFLIFAYFRKEKSIFAVLCFATFVLNSFHIGLVLQSYNDIFVAAFIVFALFTRDKNQITTSAIFLSIAGLFKFYPFVLIPFLAMHKGKLNKKFLFVSVFIVFIVFFICFLLWGLSAFAPILQAIGRGGTSSIFSFLSLSEFSPLRILFPQEADFLIIRAITTAMSLLIIFFGISWWYYFVRSKKINWIDGSVFVLLWLLTFYKLGFSRFFISFFFLFAYWYQSYEYRSLLRPPYALIIAVASLVGYFLYGEQLLLSIFSHRIFEAINGIPVFCIEITILYLLYKRILLKHQKFIG